MTFTELAKMRANRMKPAMPIHITDIESVFDTLTAMDYPVIWHDMRQELNSLVLRGLDVVLVSNSPGGTFQSLQEANTAYLTGFTMYGFKSIIEEITPVSIWS